MAQRLTPAPILTPINSGGIVAGGGPWALWFASLYNLINALFTGNFTSLTLNSGPSIMTGAGAPTSTPALGSLYLRTDTGELYVYQSAGWTGK